MHRTLTIYLTSLLLVAATTGFAVAADPGPLPAERSEAYREARAALDAGDWHRAGELFEAIAETGGAEADAAMYWTAYALNKQGRGREASRLVERLRSTHPDSPWLDDAEALAVEIGGVDPAEVGDEELKLYALNSLLHADAERAIPILEEFLAGEHSLRLKRQALFVFSQSPSPKARQILADVATGRAHPGLQREAVGYLALSGDPESRALLEQIYRSASDHKLKKTILESFMVSGDKERLLAAARTETDEPLRRAAIRLLGAAGGGDELLELYRPDGPAETKKAVLEGLMMSGATAAVFEIATGDPDPVIRRSAVQQLGVLGAADELKKLYSAEPDRETRRQILEAYMVGGVVEALEQAARTETDPELRRQAIQLLGVAGGPVSGEVLLELYGESRSTDEKLQIVGALFVHGDAPGLIEIVRTEADPSIRRKALESLSMIDSDEAVDFLLETLQESGDDG